VDDAIEATLLVTLSPNAEGEVFNVGTGIETSVNSLIQMIFNLYDYHVEPVYVDRRDIDNIRCRVVSIEKIRRKLRWVPHVTLAEALRRTQQWFLSLDQ